MTFVLAVTMERHVIALREADRRVVVARCGVRAALVGAPCPVSPGHLIAYPGCPQHRPVRPCQACLR